MIDTWNCDICKKEREDEFISVFKHDRSEEHDLPEGTFTENVKYCNDDLDCSAKAKDYIHFKKGEAKGFIERKSSEVMKRSEALTIEEIKEKKEKKEKLIKGILSVALLFLAFNILNSFLQESSGKMTFWESFFYGPYVLLRLFLATVMYFHFSSLKE